MSHHKGTEKVLERLQQRLIEGEYYEAHQMYRTVCNRFIKQKNYEKAISLLHSGAIILLSHDQDASAGDLGLQMLQVFEFSNSPVDETTLGKAVEILEKFNPGKPRDSFARESIKWSMAKGNHANTIVLHYVYGILLWKEERLAEAMAQLVCGPSECLHTAIDCLLEFKERKVIANAFTTALCKFLVEGYFDVAEKFFTLFSKKSVERDPLFREGDMFTEPILNFSKLLLVCLEKGTGQDFLQLTEYYQPFLKDCDANKLMDDIGKRYFQLAKKGGGNLLQDMMSSLFAPPPTAQTQNVITSGDID